MVWLRLWLARGPAGGTAVRRPDKPPGTGRGDDGILPLLGNHQRRRGQFFGLPLRFSGAAGTLLSPWFKTQTLAILSLPLMVFPWKRDLRLPAWVGYGIYPAHLVVLWLLDQLG